jgi:hypothetical protein
MLDGLPPPSGNSSSPYEDRAFEPARSLPYTSASGAQDQPISTSTSTISTVLIDASCRAFGALAGHMSVHDTSPSPKG